LTINQQAIKNTTHMSYYYNKTLNILGKYLKHY